MQNKSIIRNLKLFKMNNLPIRFKIIALLLVISILPSIILGFLISWTVDKVIEKQVTEHTLQLIGQANKSFDSSVENLQNISYLISFDPTINNFLYGRTSTSDEKTYNEYQLRRFLQGFTTVNPEIAGILVATSDGEYISNEMYARSIKPLKDEVWFKKGIENNGIFEIIGHPVARNIASHVNYRDTDIVSGVKAILEPGTREVLGVILIDLKLRVISDIIKDVKLGKSGYLMVIDEEGNRVYSPEESLIDDIDTSWFNGETSGSFSKKINGNTMQFIYLQSPYTHWTTIGVFSTSESVFEVQQIKFFVISFLFIVCLIGIGLSYYLSHSISKPIRILNSIMNKVEAGDLSIRYRGEGKDEIGQLGQSLNKMLMQITKLISLNELQERQKREAELRVLQAHIKPHFLYNTLDTINWMARKKGAEDVAEVIGSLSQLFRIGLSKGQDMVPLEQEIEHIDSYLKIQQARYQQKLNYSIQIAPDLESVSVLKLVLQPIVENAIYHGIKERRGPGHILIAVEQQGSKLVMRVTDDGVGIKPERLIQLEENLATQFDSVDEEKRIGYGVMNVQARLTLTFGEQYGLSIESEVGKGTTVTILLPIIKS